MKTPTIIKNALLAVTLMVLSLPTITSAQQPCQANFTYSISGPSPLGYTVNFFDSTWTLGTTTSWQWSFGDGTSSTLQNPNHVYSNPGTYVVCLVSTGFYLNVSCTSTWCDTIVVPGTLPVCAAWFSAIPDTTGTNAVYFINLSTATPGSNYSWTFGDGGTSTLENPTHGYNQPGTYQVCLTVIDSAANCSNTWCNSVTVSNGFACNAMFTWTSSGATGANFTNLSTGSGPNPYYYWTFGDGTTSWAVNPSHTYATSGTYQVCLTLIDSTSGCSDIYCNNITIQGSGSNCQANFVWTSNPSTGMVAFTNTSTGSPTQFQWSFGDGTGSSLQNPTHTYNGQGTYVVCLTIFGTNCQSTYCDTVVVGSVFPNCSSNFAIYPDSTLPHTYWAYNLATGAAPLTYTWSWGDSTFSTGAYPSHTYAGPGLYTICLTISDATGCSSTTCYNWQLLRIENSAPVTINVVAGSTGLQENDHATTLSLFPNPASEAVTLSWSATSGEEVSIQLFNIEGRLVNDFGIFKGNSHETTLNLQGIPAGLYLVKFSDANGLKYHKIVIK
ncbi:MAG TPA: PKD domain-containing protein [Bacteroidia bacterium]|nr:PKD domain-containing protein [Bacteroidia bacterium]